MSDATIDLGARISEIADELRAMAANGLHYGTDEYDRARYHRTMDLAAELLAIADTRPSADIVAMFRGDLTFRTPHVGADGAVFDSDGRVLLAQRADNGLWCLPGGSAEVGEPPSVVAAREVWEETGLRVRPTRLLGIFDNRVFVSSAGRPHAYHLVFQCEVVGGELALSSETVDLRWVDEPQAVSLPLFGTHAQKIPEAFRLFREPHAPAQFH